MRQYLTALLAVICIFAITHAQQPFKPSSREPVMLKAVVHINFADSARQEAGLKNIENILKEEGDAQIEVICHGEGISLLTQKMTPHLDLLQTLMKHGVRFVACENTMKKKSLSKSDLVEGSTTVPSGAVEVIRKQSEGFGYFRP